MVTSEQSRAFERDGYFVLPSFWSGTELTRLQEAAELVRAKWRAAQGLGRHDGDQPFSVRNLIAHHDAFLNLCDHPKILPLILGTLGANVQLKTSHLDYRPSEPPNVERLQREMEAKNGGGTAAGTPTTATSCQPRTTVCCQQSRSRFSSRCLICLRPTVAICG
jgi:hypothetical protein